MFDKAILFLFQLFTVTDLFVPVVQYTLFARLQHPKYYHSELSIEGDKPRSVTNFDLLYSNLLGTRKFSVKGSAEKWERRIESVPTSSHRQWLPSMKSKARVQVAVQKNIWPTNHHNKLHSKMNVGTKCRLKPETKLRHSLNQGSPTFLKLRATSRYRFMRRANSLIHTRLK